MPSKNIYVSADDTAIFDEAAQLAGGLSAAVASGLRLFLEAQRRAANEFSSHDIEVDEDGVSVVKRFTGRRVMKHREAAGQGTVVAEVYETAGGRLALHTRTIPLWTVSQTYAAAATDLEPVGRSFLVFDTRDELIAALSPTQREAFSRASRRGDVEELDI